MHLFHPKLHTSTTTTTTTVLRPFFRDHPGEPVLEENFWTSWCKGRLTEADTPTIRLGATPSGLTSAHLHHPPYFLQAGCPSCSPTNSVKALKANQSTVTNIRTGPNHTSNFRWWWLNYFENQWVFGKITGKNICWHLFDWAQTVVRFFAPPLVRLFWLLTVDSRYAQEI